ncbi:MAG: hypothetical protein DRI95_11480 [Bacteroidetes bacterium]|nr:MAG: hypothetical protein DRI95_11480 [Bacteroidota bacterium]
MKNKFVLLISFLFITISSIAQSDCDDKVVEAQKLYENGKYKDVVTILKSVFDDCNIKGEEKKEAMKYFIGAYYEMDELELGEERMIGFLKKHPYYIASKKNDPYAFREELKKFKSWSRLYVGAKVGIPIAMTIVDKVYPILDTADYNQPFTSSQAVAFALEFGWNFNKYISLASGAGFTILSLSQTIPMYQGLNFNYTESTVQVSIPVYIKFSYPLRGGFIPAIYAGAEITSIYSANYSYNYTASNLVNDDLAFYLNRKRENVKIELEERSEYRRSAIAGARFTYQLKKVNFYLDFRYKKELDLYNNSTSRFVAKDLFITNSYVLPDIYLDSYEISAGFIFNFAYKVKSKY